MKRLLVATIALGITQQILAADLKTIYERAHAQDPTLAVAEATRQVERQARPAAWANILPTLTLSASTQYNESSQSTVHNHNSHTDSIALQQSLFHVPNWTKIAQARHSMTAAQATYEAATHDLILQVATQYFATLKAHDALAFASSQSKAFSHHLTQTQQRFDVGIVPITDVHEARARYDSALAQEIATQNALADEYEKLNELTGDTNTPLYALNQDIPLIPPEPAEESAWIAMATANNPTLRAAHETRTVAQQEIWRQTGQHFPTITAFAQQNHEKLAPPGSIDRTTRKYGLTASWNAFSGGSVISATKKARAEYLKSDKQHELIQRQTVSKTHQAYRGVLTGIETVRSLQQAVISNQSALEATQAAYDVGTRTIVDLLDAQTNLLKAKQDHATAYYNVLIEHLTLKKLTGVITVADIDTINRWLEPSNPAAAPSNAALHPDSA